MRQTRRKGKDNVNKYRKKVSRGVRNQGKRGTRKYNGLPRRTRKTGGSFVLRPFEAAAKKGAEIVKDVSIRNCEKGNGKRINIDLMTGGKVQVRLCGDIHFKKPSFNLTDYAGKVAITGNKDKDKKQFRITTAKKIGVNTVAISTDKGLFVLSPLNTSEKKLKKNELKIKIKNQRRNKANLVNLFFTVILNIRKLQHNKGDNLDADNDDLFTKVKNALHFDVLEDKDKDEKVSNIINYIVKELKKNNKYEAKSAFAMADKHIEITMQNDQDGNVQVKVDIPKFKYEKNRTKKTLSEYPDPTTGEENKKEATEGIQEIFTFLEEKFKKTKTAKTIKEMKEEEVSDEGELGDKESEADKDEKKKEQIVINELLRLVSLAGKGDEVKQEVTDIITKFINEYKILDNVASKPLAPNKMCSRVETPPQTQTQTQTLNESLLDPKFVGIDYRPQKLRIRSERRFFVLYENVDISKSPSPTSDPDTSDPDTSDRDAKAIEGIYKTFEEKGMYINIRDKNNFIKVDGKFKMLSFSDITVNDKFVEKISDFIWSPES